MCVAIIADDLTGACDTAIQLKHSQRDVRVFLDPLERLPWEDMPAVFAFYTDSRALAGAAAYERVFDTALHLKKQGVERFYKKIDSMFRGNAVQETAAMMDALHFDLAIVAAAAPLNDRHIIDGMVVSRRMGKTVPAAELFAKNTDKRSALIPLSLIRKGPVALEATIREEHENGAEILFMDAETLQDLSMITYACGKLEKNFLPVGTSGWFRFLSEHWGFSDFTHTEESPNIHLRDSPVLYVVGTVNPITACQVNALIQHGDAAEVFLDTKACLEESAHTEVDRVIRAAKEAILSCSALSYSSGHTSGGSCAHASSMLKAPLVTAGISSKADAQVSS